MDRDLVAEPVLDRPLILMLMAADVAGRKQGNSGSEHLLDQGSSSHSLHHCLSLSLLPQFDPLVMIGGHCTHIFLIPPLTRHACDRKVTKGNPVSFVGKK
jgi:hypothetical protein